MKWGNVTISKKQIDGDKIVLVGTVDEADQNFKGTKKYSWLTNDPERQMEITLVELDHLITKQKIEESDDITQIVNTNSRIAYQAICEKSVGDLKERTHLQFERLGYFFIDKQAQAGDMAVLSFVPNGKTKGMTSESQKISAVEASKGKGDQDAGKKKGKQDGTGPDGKISKG